MEVLPSLVPSRAVSQFRTGPTFLRHTVLFYRGGRYPVNVWESTTFPGRPMCDTSGAWTQTRIKN